MPILSIPINGYAGGLYAEVQNDGRVVFAPPTPSIPLAGCGPWWVLVKITV